MEKPELNWSSELSHERGIGFRTDTKHAWSIYPFQTGLESEGKGLLPTQLLENPLQKQTDKQNKEKKTKRQTEGARGWGCAVGKRYSLSNAGLLNRQASL